MILVWRFFGVDIRNQHQKLPLPTNFERFPTNFNFLDFFDPKFQRKFQSKINFLLEGSKFVGRGSFWCWFRISTPKNRQTNITWVMADFRLFSGRHGFWIDVYTLKSWVASRFFSFSRSIRTQGFHIFWSICPNRCAKVKFFNLKLFFHQKFSQKFRKIQNFSYADRTNVELEHIFWKIIF